MSVKAMAWAWEREVPSTAKFVLLALADHADNEGVCWPGQKWVAEKTGFGRQTVNKSVAVLAELNLIEVKHRYDAEGRPQSNYYRLCIKEGGNVADDDRSSLPKRQGIVADDDTEPSVRTDQRTDIVESQFDNFYQAYPRHEAKADAWKAWKALNPDAELVERMTANLSRYEGKERQFVPLPATYLRGRRWEDGLETDDAAEVYQGNQTGVAPIPKELIDQTPEQRAANAQALRKIIGSI